MDLGDYVSSTAPGDIWRQIFIHSGQIISPLDTKSLNEIHWNQGELLLSWLTWWRVLQFSQCLVALENYEQLLGKASSWHQQWGQLPSRCLRWPSAAACLLNFIYLKLLFWWHWMSHIQCQEEEEKSRDSVGKARSSTFVPTLCVKKVSLPRFLKSVDWATNHAQTLSTTTCSTGSLS